MDIAAWQARRDAWNGVGKEFAVGEKVHMPELGNGPGDFGYFEGTSGETLIYARIRWEGCGVHEYPIRYVERLPERAPLDLAYLAVILAGVALAFAILDAVR